MPARRAAWFASHGYAALALAYFRFDDLPRELARIPARDARVLLLSDCVHNAGPDPRPLAARLPRLDVLLDATGEQDRWLGGELARLGRGKFRVAASYRDVAPALSSFFAELGA